MIIGAHSIILQHEARRRSGVLRDTLKLTSVDVGDGWLIFGLPPAEVAIHPSKKNNMHEFYFMRAHVNVFIKEMRAHEPRRTRPKAMPIPKRPTDAKTARSQGPPNAQAER